MSNVSKVQNHLNKALLGIQKDLNCTVYSKTKEKYSTQVLETLTQVENLVHQLVSGFCCDHNDSGCSTTKSSNEPQYELSCLKSGITSITDDCNYVVPNDDVNVKQPDIQDLVQQVDTLKRDMSEIKTLLASVVEASVTPQSVLKHCTSSEFKKTKNLTVLKNKQKDHVLSDTSKTLDNNLPHENCNDLVKVTKHVYSDSKIQQFYECLDSACYNKENSFNEAQYVGSISKWFETRYVNHKIPINKSGNKAFTLSNAPGWVVAFCLAYAHAETAGDCDTVYTSILEWVEDVGKNPDIPFGVPICVQKKKILSSSMTLNEVRHAFTWWKRIVQSFNNYSRNNNCGIKLYMDQFVSKLKVLRLFNDEQLVEFTCEG